jgi:hypothetical protein
MALPIRVLFISRRRRRKVVIEAARTISSWIGVMTAARIW